MIVYTLWDVNRAYDKETLVGIFSTEEYAYRYSLAHPAERTTTCWTTGTQYGTRFISYETRKHEMDEV